MIFVAFNGNPVFERKARELDCPYVLKETLREDLDDALTSLNVEPETCVKACG